MFGLFESLLPKEFKDTTIDITSALYEIGYTTKISFEITNEAGEKKCQTNEAWIGSKYGIWANFKGDLEVGKAMLDGINEDYCWGDSVKSKAYITELLRAIGYQPHGELYAKTVAEYLPKKNTISLIYNLLRMYYGKMTKQSQVRSE
ncbi:hypothetical protein DFJ63DRAFT_313192 [Scheffersomyces coipomensis]|uniref:Uncharacterized protein n=1 Tax=Scheffersomyces coipomensis TaxID=1788519 RepID=M4MCW7_9ASCO|nr:putative protein [Scheffersomyces coipomensis]